MAVFVLGVVDVAAPLHELAVTAYAIRCQFIEDFLPFLHFVGIGFQHFGSLDAVKQYFAHYGMGKRGSFIHRAVLRRGGRSCGECAVGLAPQKIFTEEGTTAHQGVGCLAQELLVAGEVVIVPKVGGQPR